MYTSSPGGIALQDYHWSGGFYSPNFLSYDKWGQSLPRDLYGFNSTESEMIPQKTYSEKIQQFPIPIRNYELLSTEVPEIHLPPPQPTTYHSYERFQDPDRKRGLILFILFFLALYIFDKTFDVYIKEINIYIKIIAFVLISILIYKFVD